MAKNTRFWDIINQEDWDESLNDIPIRDDEYSGDVHIASMLLPTPMPGVWINFTLGFEVHKPGEDELYG